MLVAARDCCASLAVIRATVREARPGDSPGRRAGRSGRRDRPASRPRRRPIGLARKATPSPAAISIGRSLAPSPTARVSAGPRPRSAASASSVRAWCRASRIGSTTAPVSRPSATIRSLATTRRSRSGRRSPGEKRKPPETSAVRAPAARMVANQRARPGISRMRAQGRRERCDRQAGEHRDPLAQRGGEIDLAVHRPPGDVGDLLPCMPACSASSSSISLVTIVESMSATSSRLRRPAAGWA